MAGYQRSTLKWFFPKLQMVRNVCHSIFSSKNGVRLRLIQILVYVFILVSRAGFPLLSAFPIYNPFQAVVPGQVVVTPATYTGTTQTCICVPTGTCTGTVVQSTPVDGSGIIDIRIVNNVK